ncbi:MAG: AAA family ATPase [Myxococcales bacterium]|nr:AAA family ATPase [Myxococcales bacterium]
MTSRSEPELVEIRKSAEALAKDRGERFSTAHVLAALAGRPGDVAQLLADRRLDQDTLLRAARVASDTTPDALARAVTRARDFAQRAVQRAPLAKGELDKRAPTALHLLFALCHDTTSAAYRAMVQCGTDVAKLRGATLQLATGATLPRRPVETPTAGMGPGPRRETQPSPRGPLGARPDAPAARTTWTLPREVAPPASQPRPTLRTPTKAPTTEPHEGTKADAGQASSDTPRATPPATTKPKKAPAGDLAKHELCPKTFPLLAAIGKNLTLMAARGELDPVVGRDEEIERTLDVLAKRTANNPCLVGQAGVGKTSVVYGLARRIAEGNQVLSLDDRLVIEIELPQLLAGTAVRGSLAERLGQIRAEVKKAHGKIVLFFDEIHTLFGPDAGDEAQAELKIALSRGELPCVGATTVDEYRKYIDHDPALARRFSPIEVVELGPEEAYLAIEQLCPAYEGHHKATYAKEAIARAVTWSVRYLPGRALPDKAISILDLAGARARRRGEREVTKEGVAEVVSELSGVPEERLLETDGERLLKFEELLAERIVGHKDALAKIATVLRRNASGFRSRRPVGTFLLLGPTGVGKTETAKAVAECLFYSESAMTRIDMSEYAEAHALARMLGAPPGYVGHDAGGQLTEAVRRRPYQVVLLDEIEKAHRDVLEGFLQVFDEGRMTDGKGRTVDFTNTVILLTSNIGAHLASDEHKERGRIGFGQKAQANGAAAYESAMHKAAREALPPELYNRIDEVLAFAPLGRDDVAEVARRILAGLSAELMMQRGVELRVSQGAIEALLDHGGFDKGLGARPMRRTIGRYVEAKVAEMLLRGELVRGDTASVDVQGTELTVTARSGGKTKPTSAFAALG